MFRNGKKRRNIIANDATEVYEAHKFSSKNRALLEKDRLCGCFFCLKLFNPAEIQAWLCEGSGTALCPNCGIDSVIGESSGYPITLHFLAKMHRYWFGEE